MALLCSLACCSLRDSAMRVLGEVWELVHRNDFQIK